jgi:hypothetical protein
MKKVIAPARRPSAGMVPGWGGICLAADLPGPTVLPHKGGLSRTPLYVQHLFRLAAEKLGLQPILWKELCRPLGTRRAFALVSFRQAYKI